MASASLAPGQEEVLRKFYEELSQDGTPIYSKVYSFVSDLFSSSEAPEKIEVEDI